MDHNTCQFLQPNLERKACFAVLCCSSIHTCLFDFTLCSHRDPNLPPKKPHRLVWVEAQPPVFFFLQNLISCTCDCESCSSVDAAHEDRRHGWKKKNALCVLFDSQDINKHGDTGKGEPLLQQDVYVGALLVSGLQVRNWELAAAWQLLCFRSSSSADAWVLNDAFQRRWSHTGSQSIPPSCGHPVWMRSGAWLEDRKGSKGATKRRGKMEVQLGYFTACKQAKECIGTLNNDFIRP